MDIKYMELALTLAGKALGRTSPNPLVGAVIVKDGNIVGTGYHQKAGTPHAEIHALNEAGESARGSDLYVTLEPCSHFGRTPPCTEAIIIAGIKRVFAAMQDPNPLVSGKGFTRLREHGIEVSVGIFEKEARKLNEVFLKYIQSQIPFVALKTASSLDGKIAAEMGQSQWITGEAARLHGHSLRNIYDAILVGIGTVTADNPSLTCRLPGQTGRDPIRIIVDSKLSIGEDTRVLNQSSTAPTIIAVTAQAPADKVKLLSIEEKAIILTVNEGPEVHLPTLLEMLGKRQITSILVEGGSRINSSFLTQKLVDKFYFYLAPKIIGGARAPGSFGGKGVTTLKEAVELTDLSLDKLEPDILVIGYPKKEEG